MVNKMNGLQYLVFGFLGLAVGIFLDFVWRNTGIHKYEKDLEALEHYHWGLILLTLVRALLSFIEISLSFMGIGVTFIVAELVQNHPFAIRSNHQLSSTIIGFLLILLTIFTWFG